MPSAALDIIGSIEEGKQADLLILKYRIIDILVIASGQNLVRQVIKGAAFIRWMSVIIELHNKGVHNVFLKR